MIRKFSILYAWKRSLRIALVFFFVGLPPVSPSTALASALVVKNELNGTLDFYSNLNFSGPAATPQIAYESAAEISRLWNESRSQVFYLVGYYRVRFFISVNYHTAPIRDSGSCADNYITVERGDPRTSRSWYKLGGRRGVFYLTDGLGYSTTTAHEFGHGLGLDHDPLEQIFSSIPGIMFARGTLVPRQYQWNPGSMPGAPGGSLNPRYRKVRTLDILHLDLSRLQFSGRVACMGAGKPIPVFAWGFVPLHPPAPKGQGMLLESTRSPDVLEERILDQFDH